MHLQLARVAGRSGFIPFITAIRLVLLTVQCIQQLHALCCSWLPAAAAGKQLESKESEGLLAESNGSHHEPLRVHSIDIGVRSCFFWLSEHAERGMSMEERSAWMEATGKGECQDATVSTDAFNGLQGTTFAGAYIASANLAISKYKSCMIIDSNSTDEH